jgi:competence protein ComEC
VTRSQRGQFWLEATQLDIENESKEVTGNLYVTVPLLQVTGLHEGGAIAVTGSLYKPKPAANPGGFDFQAYLAQEGGFAGLKGRKLPHAWKAGAFKQP